MPRLAGHLLSTTSLVSRTNIASERHGNMLTHAQERRAGSEPDSLADHIQHISHAGSGTIEGVIIA